MILSVLLSVSVMAQDVIIKRNGDELQCKILEVNKNEVKYKRWSNQDGPIFTEKKSDLFMIKYENGEKEIMTYESPALSTPTTPSFSTTETSKSINNESQSNVTKESNNSAEKGNRFRFPRSVEKNSNTELNNSASSKSKQNANYNHRSRKIIY